MLHRVKQMLTDGELGQPLSITARLWCDWGRGGKSESPESTRIGFFVWTGPWYLQLLDVLVGRLPRRVSAVGVRALNGTLMDHGWASLDYGDSLVGRFEYSLLAPEGQATALMGTPEFMAVSRLIARGLMARGRPDEVAS